MSLILVLYFMACPAIGSLESYFRSVETAILIFSPPHQHIHTHKQVRMLNIQVLEFKGADI